MSNQIEIEVIRRDKDTGEHLEAFWIKMGYRPVQIGEKLEIINIVK